MFSIQEMLSGDIVKPRQAPQGGMDGLGTLLGFLSKGQTQMPQLAPMPQSHPVDASAMMHMIAQGKKDEGNDYLATLIGEPGTDKVPTPWKDAHDATGGSGFLGGQMKPMEFMARLAKSPDEHMASTGLAMLNEQFQPRSHTGPSIHSMGAPGQPGYKVNFYMDENNQAVPVGEPYKEGSGVTVNMGGDGVQHVLSPEEKRQYGFTASSVVGVDRHGEMKVIQQPTEAQGKDTGRSIMQDTTNKQLGELFKTGYNPAKITKDVLLQPGLDAEGAIGPGIAAGARKYMDPKAVQYQQIQNTWVETFGRDASGGAIKPEEYGSWRNMYFTQPGDDAITAANKAQARAAYERSLSARSGEASIKDLKSQSDTTPDTNQVPEGWNDELEAEFQREKAEGKIK